MARHILSLIPAVGRIYAEPFAGRGNVFFRAYSNVDFRYWWINDKYKSEFLRKLRIDGRTFVVPDRSDDLFDRCKTHRRSTDSILLEPFLVFGGADYRYARQRSNKRGSVSKETFQANIRRAAEILCDEHYPGRYVGVAERAADDSEFSGFPECTFSRVLFYQAGRMHSLHFASG
jgi:hypothetical protein